MSSAILYVDLSDAFYSAIGKFVYSAINTTDDAQLAKLAADCQLPPTAYHKLLHNLHEASTLHDQHYSRAVTEELCADNYFAVTGTNVISRPRRGSTPGDSYADILFNLVMSKVLSPIRHKMIQQD